MLFKKKGWLRREYDDRLFAELHEAKAEWDRRQKFLEQCVDVNDAQIAHVEEAKTWYFLLLREAKYRRMNMSSY
ncbi:YaaL family protein [Bacillus fonticola]|uniref:YaaL family protein n=1 Tax=Bacillus fonticola TaxID=2728853 RepID=UPI001473A6FD|nr:YaaL family protein [Bacillus fonticola]